MEWVEFLEVTWVRDWSPTPRDAWKRGCYGELAVEVPLTILFGLASSSRLQEIRRDSPRLERIRGQLAERGVDEPLTVVVDSLGHLALGDGHHRLLCAAGLGWGCLPVRVVTAERIRSHGVEIAEVLTDLLCGVAEPRVESRPPAAAVDTVEPLELSAGWA